MQCPLDMTQLNIYMFRKRYEELIPFRQMETDWELFKLLWSVLKSCPNFAGRSAAVLTVAPIANNLLSM